MEEGIQKLETLASPRGVGALPGSNNGGGRRASIEKIKDEVRKENWNTYVVDLAEKLWPGLERLAEDPDAKIRLRTIEMVFAYAYGRPKESVDHTTNGKDLPTPILPLNHVRTDDRDTEDHSAHKANQGTPRRDEQLEDGIDALIPDSESAGR